MPIATNATQSAEPAAIAATIPVSLPILLHPEPAGGYSVEVPALPGCHTQGETAEEAIAHAIEAAEGWLLVKHEMQTEARAAGPDR